MKSRSLVFLTLSDVSASPYAEIALPCLARAGWRISIVAPNASKSLLRSVSPFDCETRDLPAAAGIARELAVLRALLQSRLGKADVIYINSQGLSSRSRLGLLGPLPGKKLVYHNPDFYDPFTYPWRYRLEGQLCRKADLYINNEFHRGYITKTLYQLSCPVITAPPNLPAKWPIPEQSQSRRRELTANEENAFVIIQHGPFTPLRTGEELLQALTHLPRRFRVAFTGGQATRDAVQPHVDRLKLQDRVTVLPRLPFNQMLSYTVNADAGLLLYSNNDLGNFFTAPGRLTEYLACGIPVIASNHTGLENLVLRVGAGEPVDSTTPSDIARGIEALANAKERGAYEAQHLKHAFSNTLAFENWENTIQESFNNLLEGIPIPTANPPFPWLRRQ